MEGCWTEISGRFVQSSSNKLCRELDADPPTNLRIMHSHTKEYRLKTAHEQRHITDRSQTVGHLIRGESLRAHDWQENFRTLCNLFQYLLIVSFYFLVFSKTNKFRELLLTYTALYLHEVVHSCALNRQASGCYPWISSDEYNLKCCCWSSIMSHKSEFPKIERKKGWSYIAQFFKKEAEFIP